MRHKIINVRDGRVITDDEFSPLLAFPDNYTSLLRDRVGYGLGFGEVYTKDQNCLISRIKEEAKRSLRADLVKTKRHFERRMGDALMFNQSDLSLHVNNSCRHAYKSTWSGPRSLTHVDICRPPASSCVDQQALEWLRRMCKKHYYLDTCKLPGCTAIHARESRIMSLVLNRQHRIKVLRAFKLIDWDCYFLIYWSV